MRCSKCDEVAIVYQRYADIHLCQEHFVEDFERKVEETLLKRSMIEEKDRIAVAVSGGKDSLALLYVLKKFLAQKNVKLFAITIDEGINGYREDTIGSAKNMAENLAIEHEIVSFRSEYGFDLDDIVQGKEVAPCTFCGVFRKNALNKAAKRLGATKVATGHNLDDESQSIMMNYLKGDIERLMRFRPKRIQPGLVPRIKPLQEIPEKEIALYGIMKGFYVIAKDCPYACLSLRSDVRNMMNEFESLFPGTKYSTKKGFELLEDLVQGKWPQLDLSQCEICSEPCVKDVCKTCELLGRLKT